MAEILIVLSCLNIILLIRLRKKQVTLEQQALDLQVISAEWQKRVNALELSESQLRTAMFTQANCVTIEVSAKNKKSSIGNNQREQDIGRSLAFQLGYKILKHCIIEQEIMEDGVVKYKTRINIYPEKQ